MQLIVSSSSEKPEPKLRTEYTTLDLVVFIGSCICIFPYLIICLPDTVWKEACPVSRSYRWQTPADGTRRSSGARRGVEACRKWLIKDVHHLCFPGGFQRCWIHSSVFLLKLLHQLATWKTSSCSLHFKQILPLSAWCPLHLYSRVIYLIWWRIAKFPGLALIPMTYFASMYQSVTLITSLSQPL